MLPPPPPHIYTLPISFQKRLVAKTSITNEKKETINLNIYHLDEKYDARVLKNALNEKGWKGNHYLNMAHMYFEDEYNSSKFYVMENDNRDLMCFSVLDDKSKHHNSLTIIETKPQQSSYMNEKRSFKYIGETMLAFLAKITKKQGKKLRVGTVASRPETEKFYFEHCRFKPSGKQGAVINEDGIQGVISMNERHTQNKIKLFV